jgi:hypothetical protein
MNDNNRSLEMLGKILFGSLLLVAFSILQAGVIVAKAVASNEGNKEMSGFINVLGVGFLIWGMAVLFHVWLSYRST